MSRNRVADVGTFEILCNLVLPQKFEYGMEERFSLHLCQFLKLLIGIAPCSAHGSKQSRAVVDDDFFDEHSFVYLLINNLIESK